ncbi:undecaprenyl-diphosphate phosphatase [Candidatus Peregrinibacteria bacterium]|jgi:undecaprenyl-diphosphatase|nr:undecaprenyl-diphosphate phosphatase [Candidatus Peregrinibacteria bacterium]
MTILQSIILGIIQGITEFLPISSSGHLVILEEWFTLPVEQLRGFDVLVHVGTLLAIFIYFRSDFKKIILDVFKGKFQMAFLLILGTIPAVIAGFTMSDLLDNFFRSSEKVALAMIAVAVLFVVAEYVGRKYFSDKNSKGIENKNSLFEPKNEGGFVHVNTFLKVLLIGLFQALALIPGVSRSGSTISAGLLIGMTRHEAARFSFILGSIAIFGAGLLTTKDVISDGLYFPNFTIAAAGFVASLLAGYLSVAFLMKFLKNHSLHVFAFYLLILGGGLILF